MINSTVFSIKPSLLLYLILVDELSMIEEVTCEGVDGISDGAVVAVVVVVGVDMAVVVVVVLVVVAQIQRLAQ